MSATPASYDYVKNAELLDELETYYSYVLDNIGLNVADPVSANIGFFNNSGKVFADPQKSGRTRVYITRPNLNLRNVANVERSRILSYASSSVLGTTLARFLMYPSFVKDISIGGCYKREASSPDKENLTYGRLGILKGTAWDGMVGGKGDLPNAPGSKEDRLEDEKLSYVIDKTPFIPVLGNLCSETSGGKDIILETEQTDSNFSGNHLVYASGINESRGPGEITLSFEDIYGSPAFYIILMWVYYMHYVAKGVCNPEIKYIINRILDYTCSIYVFTLDTDQKTIIRGTRYTGAFPKMIPFANIMHSKDIDIQALSKFSIPFQYNMASPMDPAIFREFNMISECTLVHRGGEGSEMNEFGVVGERCKSADLFFYGRNHIITEREALFFRNTFNPPKVPSKLLRPRYDIDRANDIDQYSAYDGFDSSKLFGDTSNIDEDKPTSMGGLKSFSEQKVGMYHGYLGDIYNYRSPYIADGNKLMYL
jgi:hypothetical protein